MGWDLYGDVDIGVRHPGPKVNGVSISIRHGYSLLSGEVTHTATASRGKCEIVGVELANPGLANALELSGYDFHAKIGGLKHDFNLRPGVIGGWTINTYGSAGVRVGLGNTTFNAYVEVAADIQWVASAALDRLHYKSEFDALDNRDKVAGEAIASRNRVSAADNDPLGVNTGPNVEYYEYQDRQSGAQVRTKVVADPVTGQKRAVYSTVIDSNPEQSALRGNTYPPGKVQAGYELNALDRISEERNVWKNTPDPGPTGPQGSGIGPSDPNDPRGPWQTPGAPADRTGGTKARPGGSEGGDGRREGAAPPKPESWADRHSGPVWEGKGRGGDGTMGRTATRSQGGPKAEDRREGKAPERLDKHGRKESDPKFVGPQPVLLDLDGNGVKITEYHNATRLMTGKDGLRHRSSWAGAGDGVLFCDPDVRSAITERRQHVFTEWNPTAAGDPEAGRTGWRRKCPRWTNADGCLGSTGWQRTSGTWEGYGSRGFGGAGAAGDARSPGG